MSGTRTSVPKASAGPHDTASVRALPAYWKIGISWPSLFAIPRHEEVEQLEALAAGMEHLDPAQPAATNGIVWAGARGHRGVAAG